MLAGLVRAVSLSLIVVASACGGDGGTDPKAGPLDGDFVLLTVDGANLPTVVTSDRALVAETLLEARLEVQGASARDIKKRRKSNSPDVITDTVMLTLSKNADRTFLSRPSDQPSAQPDTATVADGIVPNAVVTLRTRSAPSTASATRMTLVYSRQR